MNTEKTKREPALPVTTILKARKAALEIAAATGYDARTALRALLRGAVMAFSWSTPSSRCESKRNGLRLLPPFRLVTRDRVRPSRAFAMGDARDAGTS